MEISEDLIRKLWSMFLGELAGMLLEYGSDLYDCDDILKDIPIKEILELVEKYDNPNTVGDPIDELYHKYKRGGERMTPKKKENDLRKYCLGCIHNHHCKGDFMHEDGYCYYKSDTECWVK